MSNATLQKVYDEAKLFVADVEHGLDGLIEAIKQHRTAETQAAAPAPAEPVAPTEPEPTP